jgi:serine/threonine protein kinase
LKNGRYLKGEEIGLGGKALVFKAKDLETDEIVVIKQIKKKGIKKEQLKIREYVNKECNLYKEISDKTEYSCKFKDLFETREDFNIVLGLYDDNLYNFFLKNN